MARDRGLYVSGPGVTVAGTTSAQQGRRAARPAAVIVLKPVNGGVQQHAATNMARRSVESVDYSTTTVDEVPGQPQPRSTLYNTSGGSIGSIEHGGGKLAESTALDIDLMSTSRGSDEDWAAFGLGMQAAVSSADPWSAIEQRQNAAKVAATTLTTTAIVGQTDDRQTDVDWSGTAAVGGTSQCGSSSCWWLQDTSGAAVTSSARMSDVFPSLGVFRHHQTTPQGPAGVLEDTERLIDDANDKSIL